MGSVSLVGETRFVYSLQPNSYSLSWHSKKISYYEKLRRNVMMCFCSAGCEITIPSSVCLDTTRLRGCCCYVAVGCAPCNLYYLFFPRPASLFCGTQGMCAPLRAEWLTVEMSFERDLAARGPLHKRWMDRPTHPHLHAAWNETAAAFLFWNYGHNLTLQKRSHHIFPIVIGQCQQGVCPLLRAKYFSRCKRESFENYYLPWEYYYYLVAYCMSLTWRGINQQQWCFLFK